MRMWTCATCSASTLDSSRPNQIQKARCRCTRPPGQVEFNAAGGAGPNHLLSGRDFQTLAAHRIDDQSVAVGQALSHASDEAQKWFSRRARIGPRERLGLRVVFEHARSPLRAEIVK